MEKPRLCDTCGAAFDKEVYQSPIRPQRLLFLFKVKPRISQKYHEGTHSKSLVHAIDYSVPVNTPVLASRDGVVVDSVSHFNEGAEDESLRFKANYVCLRHDNGRRYSRYYHLKSACVSVGDRVQRGQLIGYSGNTGFTMGPHLHFDVVDMLGTEVAQLTIRDQGTQRITRCLPMTFSNLVFPSPGLMLPLYCADPIDLSQSPYLPFVENDFAIIAARGGEPTFLEKAKQAERAGAKVLIIVDNDSSMSDAMPVLVGDSSGGVSIWVVFIAFSNYEWYSGLVTRQRSELAHFQPTSCSITLSSSPYFHPRSTAAPGAASEAFCKPLTCPVMIQY